MEILQISVIAIIATILAVTIKSEKPEISLIIGLVTGVMILIFLMSYLIGIIQTVKEISDNIELDLSFVNIVLKIIAIAYISEFSSNICKDAGENAIASKVELAGKILILFSSMPIILSLLKLLSDIV